MDDDDMDPVDDEEVTVDLDEASLEVASWSSYSSSDEDADEVDVGSLLESRWPQKCRELGTRKVPMAAVVVVVAVERSVPVVGCVSARTCK